jgi:hypothetical protein
LLDRWFGRDQGEPGKQRNGGSSIALAGAGVAPENAGQSRRGIARDPASRNETLRWANSDGTEETANVAVRDDSDFGVRLHAPAELAVGATVWLTFNGDVEKCVVRHCEPMDGAYAVGLYRVHDERRREDREVVEGKANLFWGGLGSDIRLIEVDVRDVSAGGIQVLTSRPIPLQTAVRVAGEDYACLGVTCYCRPEGERYAVGIQFTQDPYYIESAEYDG